MKDSDNKPKEIASYYGRHFNEDERLSQGYSRLEFERSKELIKRHVPNPPATILDVGGGTGIYSYWLASLGYEVHLIDLVERHIEQAKDRYAQQTQYPIASFTVGDARSLDQKNSIADAILLMGPLYHLIQRSERLQALCEAHRVLKKGGIICCAGIVRHAALLDGLFNGRIDDPYFMEILERDIAEGQHRNPQNIPEYFTTAFFHHPHELEKEIRDAGFAVAETAAIEGPAWIAKDLEKRWDDSAKREQLLNLVRAVEHEPALIGLSLHFMVIAEKNSDSG